MPARRTSAATRWDVVVIGGANTDYLVRGSRLPQPGETVQGDVFEPADAGGKGANQAVAAARLGARVAFVGRVGSDTRGPALLRRLKAEGVNIEHVSIDRRAATGVALINVDTHGEKQILSAPGANQRLSVSDVQRAAKLIRNARVLVLQFEVPMAANLAATHLARDSGVMIVLDPAPGRRAPYELLRLVTVIRPNELEAEALTGVKVSNRASARAAAKRLIGHGVQAAIIAAGRGNLLVWHGENGRSDELWLPKLPVKSIDATGAGDAFVAAVAVALVEGHPYTEAAIFANAAAALTTTKLGAQPALPRRSAVLSLLRRTGSTAEAKNFIKKKNPARRLTRRR
jgi:ribokinase